MYLHIFLALPQHCSRPHIFRGLSDSEDKLVLVSLMDLFELGLGQVESVQEVDCSKVDGLLQLDEVILRATH